MILAFKICQNLGLTNTMAPLNGLAKGIHVSDGPDIKTNYAICRVQFYGAFNLCSEIVDAVHYCGCKMFSVAHFLWCILFM